MKKSEKAVEMIDSGMKLKQVALELGVEPVQVAQWIFDEGRVDKDKYRSMLRYSLTADAGKKFNLNWDTAAWLQVALGLIKNIHDIDANEPEEIEVFMDVRLPREAMLRYRKIRALRMQHTPYEIKRSTEKYVANKFNEEESYWS